MSLTEGMMCRVQRGESFKESLEEWKESKVWPNLSREKEKIEYLEKLSPWNQGLGGILGEQNI